MDLLVQVFSELWGLEVRERLYLDVAGMGGKLGM